jgi:hypothetical protein
MGQGFQIQTEIRIFAIVSVRLHISISSKKAQRLFSLLVD